MGDEGVTTRKPPRSFVELIAECDGEQAAILLKWATRVDRATEALDPMTQEPALVELRAVAGELREAAAGLNLRAAQAARDASASAGAPGFAPQRMLRTRPK